MPPPKDRETGPPPSAAPAADSATALLCSAFDALDRPLAVVDSEGMVLEANAAAARLLGLPREELLGWPLTAFVNLGMELDAARSRLFSRGRLSGETQLASPEGERLRMRYHALAHAAPDRHLVWLETLGEAAAQPPAAETDTALDDTQLLLPAAALESSQQAVLITNAENRIVWVNEAFTRITGYDAAEVVGQDPRMLGSGRHGPPFYETMWSVLKAEGRWQGEIWNRRKNGEVFAESLTITAVKNRRGDLVRYVGMFHDGAERKKTEAKIRYLANYDSLTGLPNRGLLADRFELLASQAKRSRRRLGLIYIDLDHFKRINDTLGHSTGDQVLARAAKRVRDCVRQADVVARLSGDEFLAVITDMNVVHDAAFVAGKIIDAMEKPMTLGGHELRVTPSLGISIFPDDGTDLETLLKNADIAMFHAKHAGRNNYQFYAAEMNEAAFERLAFETSLRRALERNEFRLHYQPLVCIADGRVTGVEALIRWQHPDLGLVMPANFIPVAEETGLIAPISLWALREAGRQARRWQEQGLTPPRMSVNISPIQVRQRNFVDDVLEATAASGLTPGMLELELTESAIMQDSEAVIAKLEALTSQGVHLAVDDFGTGYSSLSYLKRFPIKQLKIDQSFVRDIGRKSDDEAIIQAVVGMARSLRLTTVAEGVETREQLEFLRLQGCDTAQGFLFSRPLPAEEFAQVLAVGNLSPG